MNIYRSITDLIEKTPFFPLEKYGKAHFPNAAVLAKLEYFNPAGSAKNRGKTVVVPLPVAGSDICPLRVLSGSDPTEKNPC